MTGFSATRNGFREGGTPGPAGPTGPTGATGNGAVFTSVDSLHASPRSVTDWGPSINTAIAGGTTTFVFGPFVYPFSTTINFAGGASTGISFYGSGVWQTYLRWTGTGSGTAVDCSSHQHPGFYSFSVDYTQNTFTGSLFKFNNAFTGTFHKVRFGHDAGDEPATHIGTAYCALDLGNMNTLIARDCEFASDFSAAAVSGRKAAGPTFSNVVRFDVCTFHGKAIVDPALDYLCTHCIFETTDLGANESAIYNSNSSYPYSLTLRDCCYWDPGANKATNRIVDLTSGAVGKFEADSCYDEAGQKAYASEYRIRSGSGGIGNSSVVIRGGYTGSDIDVGDAQSSQRKVLVSVTGVDFQSSSGLLHHQSGHDNLHVAGNSGLDFFGGDGDIPIAHERGTLLSANKPTAAAHTGITNMTVGVDKGSTDSSGVITLNNTAGGTSATGLLVDVTFGSPPSPTPSQLNYLPYVVVGPAGLTSFWDGSKAAACQPYGQVTASSFSGFSIGVNVGIAAGATVAFAYRVTWPSL